MVFSTNSNFHSHKPVIGVLQLLPLPGSADWNGHLSAVIHRAEQEANALISAGVDAILLENTGDIPYPNDRIDPAGVAALVTIANRIQQFGEVSLGISILANDPESALAVAITVGAKFIRVPVLVGSRITESGMLPGKITELTAYRQKLKTNRDIAIMADVTMNHIVPTPQFQAPWRAPQAYLAQVLATMEKQQDIDGLILNQAELSPSQIDELSGASRLKILVGDTFDTDSILPFYQSADGLILKSGIQKQNTRPGETPSIDPYQLERLLTQIQTDEAPNITLTDIAAGKPSA